MTEIAAVELDLSYTAVKMGVRVFAPERNEELGTWSCTFKIGDPINVKREIHGVSTLQALFLAMKTLSVYLYGSDLYKRGELGIYGEFGGSLSIPASKEFLDIAPYPF
jgi:hypothetical protein